MEVRFSTAEAREALLASGSGFSFCCLYLRVRASGTRVTPVWEMLHFV